MKTRLALAAGSTVLALAGASDGLGQQAASTMPSGYLAKAPPEEILALAPAPPAPGSAAEARDIEASEAALKLQGAARWNLATTDADLRPAAYMDAFSCTLGAPLSPATTPKTATLMLRTLIDFGLAPYPIKNKYARVRPFMVNGKPLCTPDREAELRRDGSYPSGHAALGYGWGLVLGEVAPDRALALAARGRAFGDSRRICNVHWLSDTEEGRMVGAAVFARLQSSPEFQADLEASRAEIAALRASGAKPARDCAAEAAALAMH